MYMHMYICILYFHADKHFFQTWVLKGHDFEKDRERESLFLHNAFLFIFKEYRSFILLMNI